MVNRNIQMSRLKGSYLFSEIDRRKQILLSTTEGPDLISLGTGDTSQPIPSVICNAMEQEAKYLGTKEGYKGYPPDFGPLELRQKIASVHYQNQIDADEIFISDGTGCDIARLMTLFGTDVTLAVQDPSYPAYADNGVIMGQAGDWNETVNGYNQITYMKCHPGNDFFPDLNDLPKVDIIAFCSPNNPTGEAATKKQLQQLIDFANSNRSIILYDAVYTPFIQDPSIPSTLYGLKGAKESVIECQSFSKSVGFTGVRLAWSVVPKQLQYNCGFEVRKDWKRLSTTAFNGISWISQAGGMAALSDEGLKQTKELINYYHRNAARLASVFEEYGLQYWGGKHSPYLWLATHGRTSWEAFEQVLYQTRVVTIPGSGFGPAGEGFLRFSAFGQAHHLETAIDRLRPWLEKNAQTSLNTH